MGDNNIKLYYNIREVAEMMQLPEHTLRFWEKEFPSLNPKKSSGGTRQYTQRDIEYVRLIHHLVKEQGLTIKAARARLKTSKQKVVDRQDIMARLKKIRDELKGIASQLEEKS